MTLVSAVQNSWLAQLPQDVWGPILSYTDFDDLKNYRLISKIFVSIVEKGCLAMCRQFHLDNDTMELSFRRIINLGSLIQEWTHPKDIESILSKAVAEDRLFKKENGFLVDYISCGMNPYDYRPKIIDPSNLKEVDHITKLFESWEEENEFIDALRSATFYHLRDAFSSFSIQGFLDCARFCLKYSMEKYLIRCIVYMTPYIFRNHSGKDDFVKLIVGNTDDLHFLLSYPKEKADRLLDERWFELTATEIKNLIVFYLCSYDVETLHNLLKKIKASSLPINQEVMDIFLSRTNEKDERDLIMDTFLSCLDEKVDGELIFVKFLLICKEHVLHFTGKSPISHLVESNHVSLLAKLQKEKNFTHDLDRYCFHHVKTAEVAEELFNLLPQHASKSRYGRSPLLTALMENNMEVVEFLTSENCDLDEDDVRTSVQLVFSKKHSNESKRFVLKELICQIGPIAIGCFATIAFLALMIKFLVFLTSQKNIGLFLRDYFNSTYKK